MAVGQKAESRKHELAGALASVSRLLRSSVLSHGRVGPIWEQLN
jgi:hypothetical protein